MHWRLQRLATKTRALIDRAYLAVAPDRYKQAHELRYWQGRLTEERVLRNDHYEMFYTTFFGLERGFYRGKRILDVGCGPRGSLEWASMAAERIGIDPLANDYLRMGAAAHAMKYVSAPSESMPFEDARFDVACSFNSLDHVADAVQTAREITRVLKSGGLLLLIVEVNHDPTPTEPVTLGWNAGEELFGDAFEILETRKFEIGDHDIYGQLKRDARFSDTDMTRRPGILTAKLRKRGTSTAKSSPFGD